MDLYLLPVVTEVVEHYARIQAQEFVAELEDGLREDRRKHRDQPSAAELDRRRNEH